jgi:hypothetical protein
MSDADFAEWRTKVARNGAILPADVDELETHLRDEISELTESGLSGDEAFLIGVKRLGRVDRLTAEFAREYSQRLWKQLVLGHVERPEEWRGSALRMGIFAVVAAVVIQVARLAAGVPATDAPWFTRNIGFFVLVPLIAYFVSSRAVPPRRALLLGAGVVLLAAVVNLYPFPTDSDSDLLVAIHLPVVLWFGVGFAYLRGEARSSRQMDFVRFTGEWLVYYALIALGGAVLLGLTSLVLAPIAPDAIDDVMLWVLPSGAVAAVVVAAWLVEAKKSVIENMAPVLTAIFTPLFTVMLVVSVVVYSVAVFGRGFGRDPLTVFGRALDRDLLTVFDVLLIVVLGLVLYGLSARDPLKRASVMDGVRLAAVIAAIVLDLLVLWSMLARVGELGVTPNRVAALGLNLLLVANLAGTTWQAARLMAGRATALPLERWQTRYLPVFGLWATLVVVAIPPLFAFA